MSDLRDEDLEYLWANVGTEHGFVRPLIDEIRRRRAAPPFAATVGLSSEDRRSVDRVIKFLELFSDSDEDAADVAVIRRLTGVEL